MNLKKRTTGKKRRAGIAVALYPSLELAQRELAANGLNLDIKEIRRIAMQCGESILTLRLSMLQEYSAGVLESTDQLAGKKVRFLLTAVVPGFAKTSRPKPEHRPQPERIRNSTPIGVSRSCSLFTR
ncbi:MAG: hypothetical protein LBT05_14540 [Planctomycetaceae bacterium]|nr:hypothetical protein [Planctomycetaceae bacterium]